MYLNSIYIDVLSEYGILGAKFFNVMLNAIYYCYWNVRSTCLKNNFKVRVYTAIKKHNDSQSEFVSIFLL